MNNSVLISTAMFTNRLEDAELLQFHKAVILNTDCSDQEWYPKVKGLFRSNGKLHDETRDALDELVQIRFSK